MKIFISILVINACCVTTFAQDTREQTMEKRVREMHRVIGLTDKEQWRKFIQENYTEALINKPMRASIQEGNQGGSPTETTLASNLDAKVKMFERLHDDFGGSTIKSIAPTQEGLAMTADNGDGLRGIFQFKFEKTKPYLINGLGIQAEN